MNSSDTVQQADNYQPDGLTGENLPQSRLPRLSPNPEVLAREIATRWMWRTTLAGLLGLAAGGTVLLAIVLIPDNRISFRGAPPFNLLSIATAASVGAIFGGTMGLVQAQRLNDYLPGRVRIWWAWSTALAGALTGLLAIPLFSETSFLTLFPSSPLVSVTAEYVFAAFILGTAQWFVLRRYFPAAGKWIIANLAGGAASALVTIAVTAATSIGPLSFLVAVSLYFCLGLPFFIMAGLCTFLPLGAITGFVLARLLQKGVSENIDEQA